MQRCIVQACAICAETPCHKMFFLCKRWSLRFEPPIKTSQSRDVSFLSFSLQLNHVNKFCPRLVEKREETWDFLNSDGD